ncbi:MAG: UDP-N-acetylglucosamine--N-acetylmuramyl-(pentapeptide) pyrophosphoryl-undecaprenol N-acetylglucosamine transferase [Elusimicrobia bacterium]|nr:UDP-N-acetylglucosamine--N-acetylmuramyl-(pentapeptide) pyrophosphoryl-undecaprenol N-acetylglucosamine transferase [Elusimicrobiota bacterium]
MLKRRMIIAAGGTGGHFYPGFALAVELRSRGWQVLFIVKKDDIARPALEEADLPYAELDMTSLPRSFNPAAHAAFLLKFFKALCLARRIVADFRPETVLGTGSYVAFPVLLAARLAGVAACIHESNAKFGVGNYLAGFFCDLAALGLPVRKNPFSARSVLTGTPVRAAFAAAPAKDAALAALGLAPGKLTVLVFGGSQGARRLNTAAVKSAAALNGRFQLIHVTGRKNFADVVAAYAAAGLSGTAWLKVFDYREDMPRLYAAADLVIARSGAGTVAELALLKKPALLVPLPTSAGGHQKENALVLADKGAAVCLEEGPEFEDSLTRRLKELIEEPARAAAMAAKFAEAGIPDALKAAGLLADIMEAGTKKYRRK